MNDFINKIYNIDNLELLKKLKDSSIDSIITDFPYGLQDIDALKLIKENINNTRGFMGKAWDCLPTTDFLKECHRVLKDGSWLITTFTPRQDLQCVMYYRLLEAGFDINFSPTYWTYSSGFPKASNFAKQCQKKQGVEMEVVGKKGLNNYGNQGGKTYKGIGENFEKANQITKPTTPEAKYLEGIYSNSLKPAVEVIIIAQKPFKEKTKIDHALTWYNERKDLLDKGIKEEDLCFYTKNASGGVNIDKGRIPLEGNDKMDIGGRANHSRGGGYGFKPQGTNAEVNNQGRFPANLLVSDNCLDVGREIKTHGGGNCNQFKVFGKNANNFTQEDKNYMKIALDKYANDSGDLSRYFSLDAWTKKNLPELYNLSKKTLQLEKDSNKILPFLNCTKACVSEKNAGLNTSNIENNTHPTSKPISLFCYLVEMYSNENDIILDPLCGSGTTCIASILTNRKYIGCDLEKEYCNIAEARVKFWKEQKKLKHKDDLGLFSTNT